jgi:hypothetical protein
MQLTCILSSEQNKFLNSEPFSDICATDDGLVSTVPTRHTKVCRVFFYTCTCRN